MRFKLENISYMSHVPISDLSHMLWIGPLGRSDIGLARNDKIWYQKWSIWKYYQLGITRVTKTDQSRIRTI